MSRAQQLDLLDRDNDDEPAIGSDVVELESILVHQGFATLLVDADARLRRFNPLASAMFGLRRIDIGRRFRPSVSPIRGLPARIRECIAEHAPSTFSVEAGDTYLLVRIDPVSSSRGACTGAIVSCVDETSVRNAEKSLERQLRQAQKMEAIGQLTGGIAHDFNNILASVLGYADLLARALPAADDERRNVRRYLDEILRAGERARGLIQQLLLYSHGGGGRAIALPVTRLIDESVSMLRSMLPATIAIGTRIAAGLPRIAIDPVQGNQAVMNLAINARDAMQGRGELTIAADLVMVDEAHCASCHATHAGNYVRVRIQDTGPGLSPGTVEHVFEPFFTTKEVGKGTGLGLPVVHGIVHELGGHIAVESSDEGAAFDLLFPCSEQPSPEPERPDDDLGAPLTEAPLPFLGPRVPVLVVDDEVPLAQMLCELLELHGYRVTVCHEARSALRALEQENFRAVLCDLTMPGTTGTEFAALAGTSHPDVPVCLYTGNRLLVEDDALDRLPNVRALLDKPVDARTLLRTLESLTAIESDTGDQ